MNKVLISNARAQFENAELEAERAGVWFTQISFRYLGCSGRMSVVHVYNQRQSMPLR